jgi:hypothetical protein
VVEKNVERSGGGVGDCSSLETSYVDDGELLPCSAFPTNVRQWEVLGPLCTTQHIAANLSPAFEQEQRLSKATCVPAAAVARGRGNNLMPAPSPRHPVPSPPPEVSGRDVLWIVVPEFSVLTVQQHTKTKVLLSSSFVTVERSLIYYLIEHLGILNILGCEGSDITGAWNTVPAIQRVPCSGETKGR